MGWSGEVAIVGAYESPRRKAPGVHPFQIQAECVQGALQDAGLSLRDVDGFCSSASSPGEGAGWMDVCEVAEYLGIEPTFVDGTDTGGAAPIDAASSVAVVDSSRPALVLELWRMAMRRLGLGAGRALSVRLCSSCVPSGA